MFFDSLLRAIVLVQGENVTGRNLVEEMLMTVRDKLCFYFPFDFNAGLGYGVKDFSNIARSYQSALEALHYKAVYGKNNIVNIEKMYL